MSRAARLRRWTHVMAIVLGVGFIFAAELFKKWLRPREATIYSMVGWSFLLVAFLDWSVHTKRCPGRDLTDPAHPSRVRAYLYRSICDRPGAGLADRGEVSLALDEEPLPTP